MEIIMYGNGLDYLVRSESRAEHHKVELDGLKGNGVCSCEHFQMRLRPLLEVIRIPSDSTRCKHILAARRYLLDRQVIPRLQGMRPRNGNEAHTITT